MNTNELLTIRAEPATVVPECIYVDVEESDSTIRPSNRGKFVANSTLLQSGN